MGLRAASCAKHSNSQKREREGKMARQTEIKRERLIRKGLGGHGNAQTAHMGKEGRGCGLEMEVHAHFKAGLFIMHDRGRSQS